MLLDLINENTGMPEIEKLQFKNFLPFLDRLKNLYAEMDEKYDQTAQYYGFTCPGCLDNCCMTRFYHHTLLEYLYIRQGLNQLTSSKKADIYEKAKNVLKLTVGTDKNKKTARVMCPLNLNGLCLIYHFRPMICRLHGITYELHNPNRGIIYGSGCNEFTKLCGSKKYYKFDRTPFYVKMANLEKELRKATEITQKTKMTIAEMIINR